MEKYTLTKTAVAGGKFRYEVTDEAGNVLSHRTSKRDYVACTTDGNYYFGRLDLIGKGEHGRKLNQARKAAAYTEKDFMKDRKECISYNGREYADRWYNLAKKEQIIADRRKTGEDIIARLNRIAYLRQTPG